MKEIRIPQDGWGRIALPVMPCGHPLAARRIVANASGKYLKTDCWACAVQREIVSKIVGPKAAQTRAERRTI